MIKEEEMDSNTEQEWRWCMVGNIVDTHIFGESHELIHGTKHFRPNAKVYISLSYPGMGNETVRVIGIPRHSKDYIEIAIPRRYIHNFRLSKVFSPAVIRHMKNTDYHMCWWSNTDNDRDIIASCLDYFNSEAEKYRQMVNTYQKEKNMLTHIGTQTIETERLILRRFEYSDCEAVFRNWASDEQVQKMYSEPTYSTLEETKGLLDKYIGNYSREDYYRWAIIDKEKGECVGQIAYFLVDNKNHFAEIEYCVGSEFQCRGYCTEAAKAVIDFGFEKMNLHKVQICTKTINAPSKRVIEKCGFTYEGTLRDYFYMDGQYVGRLYFSILRDEYYK